MAFLEREKIEYLAAKIAGSPWGQVAVVCLCPVPGCHVCPAVLRFTDRAIFVFLQEAVMAAKR